MSPGASITDDILYGQTGTRHSATVEPRAVKLEDGVTEHYDRYGDLRRVEIPAGCYYSIEAVDAHFAARGRATLWLKDGMPHHGSGPAYEDMVEEQWWFEGKLHRDHGPAVSNPTYTEYYFHGRRHRDGGPAFFAHDGHEHSEEIWYQHGKKHRDHGPALIRDRVKEWYQHDLLHHDHGPAIEYKSGSVEYWIRGGYHREDGPALVDFDGSERYALDGNLFEDKKTWEQALRHRRAETAAKIP